MTPEQEALKQRIAEASWDIITFNHEKYEWVRWRVSETFDGLFHWVWTAKPPEYHVIESQNTFCRRMDFSPGDWRIALPNCIHCMTRPYG